MSSSHMHLSPVAQIHRQLTLPKSCSLSPTSANPTWESRYDELLRWRSEKGDTCVPKAEGALGRWVARQRELKRTAKLDPVREEALNSINFVWNTVTAMWEERFRRLSEWKKNHGHCAVPIAQGELGTWVSKQRQLRKRGKLSKEKIDALDSLNFTWSTAEADWEDKFKRLCAWTRERGHASVPFNEGELGWWVNTQRQCKRKGKLSPSREFRLQSLGFVWNPSNSRSRNTKPANLTSSADTTPTSTPEKPENFLCEVDSNNRILQLLGSGIASCTNENKEELLMFEDNPPPVSAEKLGIEMTPPRHPIIEPLTSPLHAPLTHHLWSPTILNPPLHNEGAMLGFSMPQCLHTHSSLDDLHPFGLTGTRQCQTDVLEQLLARDDACALYHSNIDPLHCEENL